MRLRSPAEFYIKHLCVHPNAYAAVDIKERLIDAGLDYISVEYIDKVREKMTVPEPFRPDDANHPASLNFLIEQKINRSFLKDRPMKMAYALLDTPRAKEFVEAMVLIEVPDSAIASFVTRHRGVYITPEALDLYRHYFWNINLLTSTQMRQLLLLRIEQAASDISEFKDKKSLLKSAYYKDALTIAADLPYSPTTATLVQMRLGVRPGKFELALRMMEARDVAITRMVGAAQQDGPMDSQKFLNYANGSRIIEELLQMVVKPEDSMREQLRSIALRTEVRTLPSIHQLSAGHHTVDVSPLKDPNHDDSEERDPALVPASS